MSMNPATAVNAYASAARLLGKTPGAAPGAKAPGDIGTFSDLVAKAVESVAETGQIAEAKTTALADGKGDIVDLVTAVAETELAVQTLVTVRDRVISAYQEILNMPI